ncbi:hypothetical protein ACDF64_13250 [Agromyces sp. MMS24-JH15]|uniref:aggregation-promoting factor C-terminal-like domain-containing protein n=1 Tax=Agromyces sp. MMS24-JH15 TaxID=3243765 RepID=UPI0037486031
MDDRSPRRRARTRRLSPGVAAALLLALLTPTGAAADEYPSWDEVLAAKADVASREAEATRIDALITELEAEAGRLGDAAVAAAAAAATAEAAREAAQSRAVALREAASAADARAEASASRFGRTAALLARTGGADAGLRLWFGGGDREELLAALSRAGRIADQAADAAVQARVDRASARSLSAQADVAERERDRLAREASERQAAAEAAHAAAEAEVAAQRTVVETLYAQLASLRDRTADLERRFRAGEQARAEAAAREAAAAAAAAEAAGATGTAPPPPGVTVDPAGHKAYARGAIGAYGWGEDQYRCLVSLWTRESSWRADAYNASSGAYGIPQALPGSKMASAGADWRTNGQTQIDWGLSYIDARYGSPCGAWAHSERYNWY